MRDRIDNAIYRHFKMRIRKRERHGATDKKTQREREKRSGERDGVCGII